VQRNRLPGGFIDYLTPVFRNGVTGYVTIHTLGSNAISQSGYINSGGSTALDPALDITVLGQSFTPSTPSTPSVLNTGSTALLLGIGLLGLAIVRGRLSRN